MNCYAGLAEMNPVSCHVPKQDKMKTTPKHHPDETTKRLFRQLFEVQYELDRYATDANLEVRIIIDLIDELLEKMLADMDK